MKTALPTILVVLNLPTPTPALIVRANAIVGGMSADPTMFPSPNPPLATVTAQINTLASAETACETHTAGTVAIRDAAKKTLVTSLHALKAYVQLLVNASPAEAQPIAQAAAMALKKKKAAGKLPLTIKSIASGTVQLVAKATAGSGAYEWQYSTDGKTWVSTPSSTQSKTTIPNLQPGTTLYFRQRAITKTGPSDWGDPVVHVVS